MKRLLLASFLGFLLFSSVKAEQNCTCKDVPFKNISNEHIIKSLEASTAVSPQTFETNKIRGIKRAKYFYCDDDHGYLMIDLHNKMILYKKVPLTTWFEFRFSESHDLFFKKEIKYHFIMK